MAADFEGVPLTSSAIEAALRGVAHGQVPVRDIEAAQNPKSWAGALSRAAAESHARELATALERLASGDVEEVELAMELQRATGVLDSAALWRALAPQSDARARDAVLLALVSQMGKHRLVYDDSLRTLAGGNLAPSSLELALMLLGKYDSDWLVQHATLLGQTDAERVSGMGHAATAMTATELEAFANALRTKLGALPAAFPLDAMLASLRRAGLN